MSVVIAGGTGFLGRPLADALGDDPSTLRPLDPSTRSGSSRARSRDDTLRVVPSPVEGRQAQGRPEPGRGTTSSDSSRAPSRDDLVILTRQAARSTSTPRRRVVQWTPDGTAGPWASVIDGANALVNLAGESIAGRRWTDAHKRRILDSRVLATRSLVEAIAKAASPPPVFISGSAVGYYGPLGEEVATEERAAGADFLARVCVQWEAEAMRAVSPRTRVVCIRTGLVLERDGGALAKMLPPFWFGAGGRVGSGRQYWPWIHRQDWVDLVRFAIRTAEVAGPLNATAPNPVTNADFARALGRAIGRPSLMPAPGFALKLLLGEMAGVLLLSGQRVIPAKAERLGYVFGFADLDSAFRAIFGR